MAQKELPKYTCFKEVWALKIKRLEVSTETRGWELQLVPHEEGYAPFILSEEYVKKHKPQVGGYYVVYSDGYKSYSPAFAFESGYNRSIAV